MVIRRHPSVTAPQAVLSYRAACRGATKSASTGAKRPAPLRSMRRDQFSTASMHPRDARPISSTTVSGRVGIDLARRCQGQGRVSHGGQRGHDEFDVTPRALERVARHELSFNSREVAPVDGRRPALCVVQHRDQHVRMLLPGETSHALQILLAIDRRDDDTSAPAGDELSPARRRGGTGTEATAGVRRRGRGGDTLMPTRTAALFLSRPRLQLLDPVHDGDHLHLLVVAAQHEEA